MMCISGSVGRGGDNSPADVKTVQVLLNLNLARLPGIAPLAVDGRIGDKTAAATAAFQAQVMAMGSPDVSILEGPHSGLWLRVCPRDSPPRSCRG